MLSLFCIFRQKIFDRMFLIESKSVTFGDIQYRSNDNPEESVEDKDVFIGKNKNTK